MLRAQAKSACFKLNSKNSLAKFSGSFFLKYLIFLLFMRFQFYIKINTLVFCIYSLYVNCFIASAYTWLTSFISWKLLFAYSCHVAALWTGSYCRVIQRIPWYADWNFASWFSCDIYYKKKQHPWGLLVHWLMVKLFWVFFGEKDKFITKKDISL